MPNANAIHPAHRRCCSAPLSRLCRCSLGLLVAAGVLGLLPATANAQIKRPGAHPDYSVELEPHGLLQWAREPFWDEGFGLGMRVTIPFIDNGPIKKINNNMGIGFGLDLAFFDDCSDRWFRDFRRNYWGRNCSAQDWMFPVVMQWNFFFTPIISVAGEAGIGISHERGSWEYPCPTPSGWCENDWSDTRVDFLFWGGGRFLFGDTVGLMVRLGTPYISVGVSILI